MRKERDMKRFWRGRWRDPATNRRNRPATYAAEVLHAGWVPAPGVLPAQGQPRGDAMPPALAAHSEAGTLELLQRWYSHQAC
jgi:hypothetical protein